MLHIIRRWSIANGIARKATEMAAGAFVQSFLSIALASKIAIMADSKRRFPPPWSVKFIDE
jgi:hypothetical protein